MLARAAPSGGHPDSEHAARSCCICGRGRCAIVSSCQANMSFKNILLAGNCSNAIARDCNALRWSVGLMDRND